MVEYTDIRGKKIACVELNAKSYNLCIQHSPPDRESVLKANRKWDTVMADQDGIGLLLAIWDITHNQEEKMQRTMAYVEAFIEFATAY